MNAPEKLYVDNHTYLSRNGFFAFTEKCEERSVEYTRTDAFMKRAKEAFCKATCNGCPPRSTCTSLGTCREYDNFVKYMKGE